MRGILRIAVLASGRGSNLKAILDAIDRGTIPNSEVSVVISNNSGSGALEIARSSSIPALHLSRKQFDSDERCDEALLSALRTYRAELVVLAGYMKKLASSVISEFRNCIINIHPALLPSFGGPGMYGMFVHEAVIKSGAHISGATVHIVDEEYDHGTILLQKTVSVDQDDTPASLAAKVAEAEHELYPEAIRLIASGALTAVGVHVGDESGS